LQTQNDIK